MFFWIIRNITASIEQLFLPIEEWLDRPIENPHENVPLLIVGGSGTGKKALLVKWIEYH